MPGRASNGWLCRSKGQQEGIYPIVRTIEKGYNTKPYLKQPALVQKIILVFGTVFLEQFFDGAAKDREFFFCKIFDDLNSGIRLSFGEAFFHEAVDEFLHNEWVAVKLAMQPETGN